jgi:hypothetical protein
VLSLRRLFRKDNDTFRVLDLEQQIKSDRVVETEQPVLGNAPDFSARSQHNIALVRNSKAFAEIRIAIIKLQGLNTIHV